MAELEFFPGDWPKGSKPLRYVGLRFKPKQLQIVGEPRPTKYLAVVSNRWDMSVEELVRWHWGKAGTIEHVHRVLKDELGGGVMPSNLYGANAAWLRINVMAYNLLSLLRRRVLPGRFEHARPKRLRFEVFTIPGRLSLHERRLMVTLSSAEDRTMEIVRARQQLLAIRELGSGGNRLSSLEGDHGSDPGTPAEPCAGERATPPKQGS